MSFSIPQSSINLHEEIAEAFIGSLGKVITLVYPPLQIKCINCNGGNYYNDTGPVPFDDGSICPYCNGADFTFTEQTEDVTMMLYFNPKEWINYQGFGAANIADGMIQSRGLISIWPKVQRCNYAKIHKGVEGFGFFKYEKVGDMVPFGARLKTEFLQMWKRST